MRGWSSGWAQASQACETGSIPVLRSMKIYSMFVPLIITNAFDKFPPRGMVLKKGGDVVYFTNAHAGVI